MADQDGGPSPAAESQGSDWLTRSEENKVASLSSWPSSSAVGPDRGPSLNPSPGLGPTTCLSPPLGPDHAPSLSSSPTPTNSPTLTITSPSDNAVTKPEILVHRIDERQRLARERREEKDKQAALRESKWQERDERARQYYEKHLEERRRRLEDQRMKEDKRRSAVEEKRRQKQEEEKVRHEAVMQRTMERSQRARQKPNRWSWGGAVHGKTDRSAAGFVESAFFCPLDLADLEHRAAFSVYHRYNADTQYADRRSMSTMNLSKDPVITKRLSSSSATLLHSPDRGLRRLPLSPWENTVVNRLQQPTHSYLARSRSAMSLSGDAALHVCPRSASCHAGGAMSFKSILNQPLAPSRSQERGLSRDTTVRRRTTGTTAPQKDKHFVRKSWSNLSFPSTPTLTLPPQKRAPSPGNQRSKVTAPSTGRPPHKASGRPPTPKQLKSPGGDDMGNLRPLRASPDSLQDQPAFERNVQEDAARSPIPGPSPDHPWPQTLGQNKPSTEPPSAASECLSPPASRVSAGTTNPEEATRLLAEKRRQAREQREREEEERRLQEEAQRLAQEEMYRRKAEERARREESHQRAEEKRGREEEERRLEEERAQREREETERLQREDTERLQKQREEEEARQKVEAERLRQEREKHFQKEETERLERKKRLEEIMKRTRRSEPAEKKITPHKNGDDTATSPDPPGPSMGGVVRAEHSDRNGHPASQQQPDPQTSIATLTPADERENGQFDEVIELPEDSRLSPPDEGKEDEEKEEGEERRVPIIAFQENGLLKQLGGVEDVSPQQTADAI